MSRYVAVRLKYSDNEAYTALTTLQRLGVSVERLERSDIYRVEAGGAQDPVALIRSNESIFNPNKHAIGAIDGVGPAAGEVWIEELDSDGFRRVGWRLASANGEPCSRETVQLAAERLLCNPAIERAILS